jgi:hypothetical protein
MVEATAMSTSTLESLSHDETTRRNAAEQSSRQGELGHFGTRLFDVFNQL